LNELKNLSKPPEKVVIAMEPVIALITGKPKKPDWNEVRAVVRQDNFKELVMFFDKDKINPKVKEFI
jgi:hypothetical protein